MRYPLILLIWIVAAPDSVVAAERPIPQDPVRIEKRSKDWLAWNRLTLGDAYAKIGKKDARWDEPARKTCELAARMYSLQVDPMTNFDDVFRSARKAVDAGCDDPLILYFYARSSVAPNHPGDEEYARRTQKAADAMMAGAYSPFRQAAALLKAIQLKANRGDTIASKTREVEQGLDRIIDLLSRSVTADPRGEFWEARWFEFLNSVLFEFQRGSTDSKKTFDQFDAKLAKIPGIEALRLTIRGRFLVDWAWKARTDFFAPMVSQKQFRTFEARLTEARRALEAAYKVNPNQPYVARIMLSVELGIGSGDRPTMERWFERAIELDPNDRIAFLSKLDWLDPKWHGDEDGKEMLAFGKECASTKNWITGIILLAPDSRLRRYAALPKEDRWAFMSQADNWAAIYPVYDEYLKHYPDDSVALTKFAYLAYLCGRMTVADHFFQKVGPNLTPWTEYPDLPLETIQSARDDAAKMVAEHEKKKAAQPSK